MPTTINIALIGDRDPLVGAHTAIEALPELFRRELGLDLVLSWQGTAALLTEPQLLERSDWVWCVPGSPYRSFDGALQGIRFAREHRIPFLATCGGFQHALVEYARNVIGLPQADHAESNPSTNLPIISPLECGLVGSSGRIALSPGSFVYRAADGLEAEERYNCSFGINRNYLYLFDHSPMEFTAFDQSGLPHAFELHGHPLYLGVLFQPELRALQRQIHPLLEAFALSVRKEERWAAAG